jgi:hypothetical protein
MLGVSFASFSFAAEVDLELAEAAPGGLLLGLANPSFVAAGFQSLVFTIEIGGVTFLEQTFTSVAAALAFFGDNLIPLATGDARDIEIGMRTMTASTERFQFDFLLMTPIPEPGTGALLCFGVILLACARRTRATS